MDGIFSSDDIRQTGFFGFLFCVFGRHFYLQLEILGYGWV